MGADTLGITICEDCWNDKNFWVKRLYDRDPVAELAGKGSTLLLNISSSPYTFDKRAFRLEMLRATARQHRLPFVYVNQVGGNDSLVFDGSSVAFMGDGRVAALAKSFDEDLVFFDTLTGEGDIRPRIGDEIEAVYRALALGTRDYVRKCGFKQVVIGLSGGIDSSLVAAIAVDALGPGKRHRRGHAGAVFVRRQPARRAGARRESWHSAADHAASTTSFAATARRSTRHSPGVSEDATEENLQARIRGNLLMALSNKFGSLVLSTGNKSEMAVGYCTLYGDMAGGLAVISDVPKTMVYELSRLRESRAAAHSRERIHQGPVGRAARESDRPGQPAALRRPRQNFEGVRRGSALARAKSPRTTDSRSNWCAPSRCRSIATSTSASKRLQG